MNNDLYNQTIEFQGRKYRYDPDHDIFYRVVEPMSSWDQWGWILVMLILCLLAWYVTYLNG